MKQTIAPTAIQGVEVGLFPPPPPPPPLPDPRRITRVSVFVDLGYSSRRVVDAVAAGESEIGAIVFVFGDVLPEVGAWGPAAPV